MCGNQLIVIFKLMNQNHIASKPHPKLHVVVVVPCHDEDRVLLTLDSLNRCSRPAGAVEVLIIINSSQAANARILSHNFQTFFEIKEWAENQNTKMLSFYPLIFPALPMKYAGVGWARRMGSQIALQRLEAVGNWDGIIVNLDADCTCESNYLASIVRHFEEKAESPGCSIYWEHDFGQIQDAPLAENFFKYEILQRYMVLTKNNGQNYHSFGYCQAVRAWALRDLGGKSLKKAEEDLYDLKRVASLGRYTTLQDTTVYTTARLSHRLEGGTAFAIARYFGKTDGKEIMPAEHDRKGHRIANPKLQSNHYIFQQMIRIAKKLYTSGGQQVSGLFPQTLTEYWQEENYCSDFQSGLSRIQAGATSFRKFLLSFLALCFPRKVGHYVDYLKRNYYPDLPLLDAARTYLVDIRCFDQEYVASLTLEELMIEFRKLERQGINEE